jgi:hypothetical protein
MNRLTVTREDLADTIRRGNGLDALAFYHGLTLRPLVEMLRIAHTPGALKRAARRERQRHDGHAKRDEVEGGSGPGGAGCRTHNIHGVVSSGRVEGPVPSWHLRRSSW